MARLYVVKLVAARLALRRYNAACVIQTEERRIQATQRVERLRVKRTRYVAATMIQALARGLFGKRRFAYEKELARHVASAVLVQNSWRRNKSLRLVRRVLRFNRREKAACMIQCRQRQRRAKKRYDALKLAKDRKDASTKIQSLARAVFARVLADELYEAREKYENDRYDAATYLQGAWRAREARVLFGSKLRKLMERRRLEARSQARSQACIASSGHRADGWDAVETRATIDDAHRRTRRRSASRACAPRRRRSRSSGTTRARRSTTTTASRTNLFTSRRGPVI